MVNSIINWYESEKCKKTKRQKVKGKEKEEGKENKTFEYELNDEVDWIKWYFCDALTFLLTPVDMYLVYVNTKHTKSKSVL